MNSPKKDNIRFKKGTAASSTPPAPVPDSSTSSRPYPRHVRLPFDLRDRSVKIEGAVLQALKGIFPATTSILESTCRSYIHFEVEKLPTAPLPLTVGGLPITIAERLGSRGKGPLIPRSQPGNMGIRICQDLNADAESTLSAGSRRDFFDAVTRGLFSHAPHLGVVEIIFDGEGQFHIVLADDVDIVSRIYELPGKIAGRWTMYLNEKDMCRPKRQQALRDIQPVASRAVVDVTPYDVLHPGVAVWSRYSPKGEELGTSSGVLVKNEAGDRFMTAASHGIGDSNKLFQRLPLGGEREISEEIADAAVELSFTDIALVRLGKGIHFINEPFDQQGEHVPRLTHLFGEAADDKIDDHIELSFNSPYTGAMAGVRVATGIRITEESPSTIHPTDARLQYTVYEWLWMGQDVDLSQREIPDSICGSAIWDSNGRVIGFFRFGIKEGIWKGFCASVSADEVVRAGYRLA